ncbi:MAG: bifunctional pyr operon transcriptional regulator/uracil phosphoribosyltransferase PyrR [Chloroflexota bacterium]|nr:MAG: bifunctional pyr operon transcriptional regulator/uracil phosphoribosyltransferase PyrR [Chloroflexota bacterium]
MAEKVIMRDIEIQRALTRIAHEIVEHNGGADSLLLVGLATRGVPMASRIAGKLEELEDVPIPVGQVDIALYRDDLYLRGPQTVVKRTDIPVDITDKRVVLVDDVLFTGRSIRAALDALMDYGRPRNIQLAVLVDRGHRELPIRADYVGKNVPTSLQEDVRVRLSEVDGRDEVAIETGE